MFFAGVAIGSKGGHSVHFFGKRPNPAPPYVGKGRFHPRKDSIGIDPASHKTSVSIPADLSPRPEISLLDYEYLVVAGAIPARSLSSGSCPADFDEIGQPRPMACALTSFRKSGAPASTNPHKSGIKNGPSPSSEVSGRGIARIQRRRSRCCERTRRGGLP